MHQVRLQAISVQVAEDVMKGEISLIFSIITVFPFFLMARLYPVRVDVALTAFNQDNI